MRPTGIIGYVPIVPRRWQHSQPASFSFCPIYLQLYTDCTISPRGRRERRVGNNCEAVSVVGVSCHCLEVLVPHAVSLLVSHSFVVRSRACSPSSSSKSENGQNVVYTKRLNLRKQYFSNKRKNL